MERARVFVAVLLSVVIAGAFTVRPAAAISPPANDDFANAELLVGNSGSTTGTNVGATTETGEPAHAGRGPFHSVWYSWTAPAANGAVEFSLCSSDFDTTLAAYTGSPVDSLSEVASDDDGCGYQSRITFATTSGTIYKIAVDGFSATDTGNIDLSWAVRTTPSNDDFDNATVLSGTGDSVKGTTAGATTETGEPGHPDGPFHSVWYSWTAPSTGSAEFNDCQTSSDVGTVVAVYTGAAVDSLTDVNPAQEPTCFTMFPTNAGTVYHIAADVQDSTSFADFFLSWSAASTRVDLKIKRARDATFVGNDVYAPLELCCTTSQSVLAKAKRGGSTSFVIEVENDGGATDSYGVFPCFAPRGFKVSYFDGATNVTSTVNNGTYVTPSLAPGAAHDLKVRVKLSDTAKGILNCTVGANSATFNPDWFDVVEFDVKATT